jgi:hypothetical protein
MTIQGYPPEGTPILLLKAANTVSTIVCLGFLYRYYELHELFARLSEHISRGHSLVTDVKVMAVLRQRLFWAEVKSPKPETRNPDTLNHYREIPTLNPEP